MLIYSCRAKDSRSGSQDRSKSPSGERKKDQKDKKTYGRNKKSRSRSKSLDRWQKSEFIEKVEAEKAALLKEREESKKDQSAAAGSKTLPAQTDGSTPLPPKKDVPEKDFSAPVELPEDVDEEEAMRRLMGFSSFDTTKVN